MRLSRSRAYIGLAALTVFGILISFVAASVQAIEDKQTVAELTAKMKTVCVGRFLVDLPEQAQFELTRARVDGFNITTFAETGTHFQARLAEREAQIDAAPVRSGGNKNLELAKIVNTDAGAAGKLFVHNRTVTESTASDGLDVERYRYEGRAVEALVHANGISIDLSSDFAGPDATDRLSRLIAQLVTNPGNAIPSEPGFCIDRAYLRDPLTAEQGEEIMMAAWLPDRPDIALKLMMSAGTKPDEQGLLERSKQSNARLTLDLGARVTTLRARQRNIAGLIGDELAERFVEVNDATVHSFWWEVNGSEDKLLVPHVAFTMDTGASRNGPVPSSLSEGAAIGLWDKVVTSFRLRPTQPRSIAVAAQSK